MAGGTSGSSRSAAAAALVLALGALVPFAAPAQEAEDDLDDILEGFEESNPTFEVEPEPEPEPERFWDLGGSVEISGSVNYYRHHSQYSVSTVDGVVPARTDYGGLQRLRNRLNLELDVDLAESWKLRAEGWGFYDAAYRINGREDYTSEVIDTYESDAEVGEAWISGKLLPAVDVKLGRQIVVWGRSETLRVLDVINPLDNREPGRIDLEDIRRPLAMLRVDGYLGDWSLTALAIPEIRFDERPVLGSDFYPDISPLTEEPPEDEPDSFCEPELAAALTGRFSGWDVSLLGAWFWNDTPRLDGTLEQPRLVHDRLWMAGLGGNYTIGGWLLKGEAAWLEGFELLGHGGERARLDALVGVEYYGLVDTTAVVEVSNQHLFDHERSPLSTGGTLNLTQEDSTQIALRLTRNFLRDRLHVTLLGVLLGLTADDGSIVRTDVSYDVIDALTASVGVLLYQDGSSKALRIWKRNDRVIFSLRYSF